MNSPTQGAGEQEVSQAKARLGVCLFALIYTGGWILFSGLTIGPLVWTLLAYTLFSAGWFLWVRLRPGEVPWRRVVVIFSDLGINTLFMHMLQAKGAFFYPFYLWIIVGNGMRFGARYLLLALVVGATYFGPMLFWSPYWRTNAVAGSGLLAGLIVLPLFYLALIRSLHRANERLAEEAERSQAAARAKTEFLANMSHELRTPMNGVLGIAELMRSTSLTTEQREYLQLIQTAAQSLLHVIDDVLDLAKVEAHQITLQPEPLDLESLVDDICNLLRPGAEEKGLELRRIVAERALGVFLGDPTRIRQILLNLLGNAVKFTKQGHITVEIRPEPLADGRSRIGIVISDTGVGIPRQELGRIFDKFEQADTRLARQFGGTGLGLAISRHLARLMEGDVTVSSKLGQGTTFTVTMILEPTDRPLEVRSKTPKSPVRFRALKVLVVEDNPINSIVICRSLEKLGASVISTEDGETALAHVQQQAFDVILMDVQLPIMDGLETTRRIRAAESPDRHVPIVALTANAYEEDRQTCLEAGMDLHLRKPMQLADLEGALETLRERGLIDAARAPEQD